MGDERRGAMEVGAEYDKSADGLALRHSYCRFITSSHNSPPSPTSLQPLFRHPTEPKGRPNDENLRTTFTAGYINPLSILLSLINNSI